MKKAIYSLLLSIFAVAAGMAQEESKTVPDINADLVSSQTLEGNVIAVYKRNSVRIPYLVKVTDTEHQNREFYIIQHNADLYNYLIVERRNGEVLYYPLVWADLGSIRLKDIQERSVDILNGKVQRVSKNSL